MPDEDGLIVVALLYYWLVWLHLMRPVKIAHQLIDPVGPHHRRLVGKLKMLTKTPPGPDDPCAWCGWSLSGGSASLLASSAAPCGQLILPAILFDLVEHLHHDCFERCPLGCPLYNFSAGIVNGPLNMDTLESWWSSPSGWGQLHGAWLWLLMNDYWKNHINC